MALLISSKSCKSEVSDVELFLWAQTRAAAVSMSKPLCGRWAVDKGKSLKVVGNEVKIS
jgi:hypothetical protein